MITHRLLNPQENQELYQIYLENLQSYPFPMGGEWKSHQLLDEIQQQNVLGRWSESGKLLAFILFRRQGEDCDVMLIATALKEHNKGHMKHLFNDFLHSCGAKRCFVEVHEKNLQAIGFYKGLGFVQMGTRKDFYGHGQAAYLLAKDL